MLGKHQCDGCSRAPPTLFSYTCKGKDGMYCNTCVTDEIIRQRDEGYEGVENTSCLG